MAPRIIGVIAGIATYFDVPHEGRNYLGKAAFAPRCFDRFIGSGEPVDFLFDHNYQKCVTDTGALLWEVDLFADRTALAFRLGVPDTKLGREAISKIEGGCCAASIGTDFKSVAPSRVKGQSIDQYVRRASIYEISLVSTGAMPNTIAMLLKGSPEYLLAKSLKAEMPHLLRAAARGRGEAPAPSRGSGMGYSSPIIDPNIARMREATIAAMKLRGWSFHG